jgi:hypothetical protein
VHVAQNESRIESPKVTEKAYDISLKILRKKLKFALVSQMSRLLKSGNLSNPSKLTTLQQGEVCKALSQIPQRLRHHKSGTFAARLQFPRFFQSLRHYESGKFATVPLRQTSHFRETLSLPPPVR